MPEFYSYTTMDSVFDKLTRDVTNEFNERDVIEWTGEALAWSQAIVALDPAIAFVEVKNHQCLIPQYLKAISGIARDNQWTGATSTDICPKVIIDECVPNPYVIGTKGRCDPCLTPTDGNPDNVVPDYVMLDCNGQPLNDYDVAYYRPYFDLVGEYYGNWMNSPRFRNRYTLVRPSTSAWASGIIETDPAHDRFYSTCTDEYTVIRQAKVLRFNFKEGHIAISHKKPALDKTTGYPLIPDHVSHMEAVVRNCKMRLLDKMCYSGREGACGKAEKAAADWHWYCKQAGNVDLMPQGVDDLRTMHRTTVGLMPKNKFFGFFGNLNSI